MATRTPARTPRSTAKPAATGRETTDLGVWKKRAILYGVTLPSGAVVDLKQLTLETHLTYGRTPDTLRVVATADLRAKLNDTDLTQQDRASALQEYVDHQRALLVEMLVSPTITVDDLPDIPEQDVEFLVRVANRSATEDAAGRTLGFEPLNKWAIFRDFHGCADDCPSCGAVRDTLSTAIAG